MRGANRRWRPTKGVALSRGFSNASELAIIRYGARDPGINEGIGIAFYDYEMVSEYDSVFFTVGMGWIIRTGLGGQGDHASHQEGSSQSRQSLG